MGWQRTLLNSQERKQGIYGITERVGNCPNCRRLTNLLYKPLENSTKLYLACSLTCANMLSGKI